MAALSLVPSVPLSEASDLDADRALLERAREGDTQALRWLYDRHAPMVGRFVRGLVRDPHAASDALQETFARAFRSLATISESERLLSWLLGIARHVAHEHYRAGSRWRWTEEAGEDTRHHDLTPELTLLGKETAQVVERALAAMGEGRRAALMLRVDHGLAYQEIAEVMGWSLAKAKVEVHRGREVLRAALAEYDGESR